MAGTTECPSRRWRNRAAGRSSERISAGEPDCALPCGICPGWCRWVEGHVQNAGGAWCLFQSGHWFTLPLAERETPASSVGCSPSFVSFCFFLLFLNDVGDLFMFIGHQYPFTKIYSSLLIFLLCRLLFFLIDF